MRAFIEESPHVYREEMVDFIAEEFDIDVSVITISRTLQKERISRKKVFLLPFSIFCFVADFSYKESHENGLNYFETSGLFALPTGHTNS